MVQVCVREDLLITSKRERKKRKPMQTYNSRCLSSKLQHARF